MTVACANVRELWFQRNKQLFEEVKPHSNTFKCRVYKTVQEGIHKMKGNKWSQDYDSQVLSFFKIGDRNIKFNCIKETFWIAPAADFTLFCCDGISFGDPGNAGIGVIARDCNSQVFSTLTGGISVALTSIAGEYVVLCALEWDVYLECTKIIIQSDSITTIECFKSGEIPWYIKARWLKVSKKFGEVELIHCMKDINFTANTLATRGVSLNTGERIIHLGRPSFLKRIKQPGVPYFSLC
ncbi:uncharacterized protein LOC113315284 [Papaver somniferum]|uniref:uncharacterized protein LOC113315284 n=1 Tax=Papaver somniferum TaxID=3469 RepID=UPI000E6F802D|nr:uncharacterized protein LOC113315284 [Papaver somniferum]